MRYDLIFYTAKKTSYCEKRLRKLMSTIDSSANRVVSATSPTELGEEVTHGLRLCPLVMIVGGLRSRDDDNLATVLSRVFSNSSLTLDHMRKLSADDALGYAVRCGSQMLLALPDDPDEIESLLSPDLLKYLSEKLTSNKPSK